MNDVAIEALMHDVLDGTATAEDQARLEQQLAADPALRERFTELRDLFETLNRVPMVEPPAGMHAELMQSIQSEAGRTRTPGWMAAFADAFRARPVPAFAMAAVTIGALALLLWSGAHRGASRLAGSDSPVAGTMAPPATPPAAQLEAGDARLAVTLERIDGAIVLTIDGAAPSGASLDVGTGLMEIHASIEGDGASIERVGTGAGRVRLQLAARVRARLLIDTGSVPPGDAEVTLITTAGVDRHLFAMGSRGEGP